MAELPRTAGARPTSPTHPLLFSPKVQHEARQVKARLPPEAASAHNRRSWVNMEIGETTHGRQSSLQQSVNLGKTARLQLRGRGDRAEPVDLSRRATWR